MFFDGSRMLFVCLHQDTTTIFQVQWLHNFISPQFSFGKSVSLSKNPPSVATYIITQATCCPMTVTILRLCKFG